MKKTTKLVLAAAMAAALAAPALHAGETVAATSKTVAPVETPSEPLFTFSLSAGYDSLYEFRGISLLGNRGIGYIDLNTTFKGFNIGVWGARDGGGGSGSNDYSEVDLYASYTYDFGPVAVTGGYIYYIFPESDSDSDVTQEFYVSISTNVIPYITPSLLYYYDFDLFEGGYLEFKISSSIPVYKDIISIDPYALVSYDFEYNTANSGLNSFSAGINVPFHINKVVTLSAYIAVATPLDVLSDIEDTEVWGGAKLNFSF